MPDYPKHIRRVRMPHPVRARSCALTRLAATACVTLASLAAAQPGGDAPSPALQEAARAHEIQRESFAAFDRADYPEAERLTRQLTEVEPSNFVHWYNLACAVSMQGRGEEAGLLVGKAIELGFTDLGQLQRDPQLAQARESEAVKALIANWGEVIAGHADANLELAKQQYSKGYTYSKDERLRLAYVSAFDDKSLEAAKAEIQLLADWGVREVFRDLRDASRASSDAWVVVILPTRPDFMRWAVGKFGAAAVQGNRQIGGEYSHDSKRLIAQDLGATFRHEFFHVLHWRSATRAGQSHPVWIQEGLCSLVEDFDRLPDGTILPTPSWRTNMARNLVRGGKLLKVQELAAIPRQKFSASNPLANYAQARTFFLYLDSTGRVGAWYAKYLETYNQDPSGVLAVTQTLGKPIDEVNAEYFAWVRTLPAAAAPDRPGKVKLGIDWDPGAGDGVVVREVVSREARRGGLRRGDVITAINGRPTFDINELYRVLDDYSAGEEVEVSCRRGSTHRTVRVKLQGAGDGFNDGSG